MRGTSLFTLLLLPFLSAASALSLSGKISVPSPDGTVQTYALDNAPTVKLDDSTWKLTFNVDPSVVLNQAHSLFEAESGDVTLPVTVKNGKGSFILNPAKAPQALLASSGTFRPTLLLSTMTDQIAQPLGTVSSPASSLKPTPRGRHDLPPRQGEPAFQVSPELAHTFQEEPKAIGGFKASIGVGLVVAPWVLLSILHTRVSPKYAGLSTYSALFLLSSLASEASIVTYWVRSRLYQFSPIFSPLSVVSAYTGKLASSRK